jgi:hypothetical protein
MQTSVQQQIAGLHEMTVRELRQRYAEVYGESTRAHSKPHMIRKIAWRIQALAEGDLSERARQRAAELANDADVRIVPPKAKEDKARLFVPTAADPRLPAPGGVLVRKYKGRVIRVIVMPDAFEYEGERYPSLTALAKKITGSHCNGFRFFGMEAKP